MFGFGWLLVLVLKPRFVPGGSKPRDTTTIFRHNGRDWDEVEKPCPQQ